MPNKDYAVLMAKYNLWQNQSLMAATDTLTDADRKQNRGAFFGSIEKTFSHVFWGDQIWLSRFAGTPPPSADITDSTALIADWAAFCTARKSFDQRILQWANEVTPDWFSGDLSWFSGALGRDFTRPKDMLVVQLFNHQTHHRGQIHAMLTAAGAKPDDTDVPFMPDPILNM
ncbi:DinB family protein [hydrothermal vent metagenome]|uniref:DinB family protein n=1 Tax=hydrothermal vent metagenome TaxID=652676 RepID=A0A3B0SEL5_9ZZZZ